MLIDVELPLALRTIMAGVNQTLMMALYMVVVASMIAVEGLGLLVLRGIGRLDIGLAATGGLGIVILAVVFDRLTQAAAHPREERMLERGPVGLLYRLFVRRREARRARPLSKIAGGAA
jgi:glycine betaine/proline transport system permease protein